MKKETIKNPHLYRSRLIIVLNVVLLITLLVLPASSSSVKGSYFSAESDERSSQRIALVPTVETPGINIQVSPTTLPIPDPTAIPVVDNRTEPKPTLVNSDQEPNTGSVTAEEGRGIGNIGQENAVNQPDGSSEQAQERNRSFSEDTANGSGSMVELYQDYYKISATKEDAVKMPGLDDKCSILHELNFKTKNTISGVIRISNTRPEQYRNIPANNEEFVYGACEIGLEGFAVSDIENVVIKTKIAQDWVNGHNADTSDLKLYFTDNAEKILDNRADTKKVEVIDKAQIKYIVLESFLDKLPNDILVINAKTIDPSVTANNIASTVGPGKYETTRGLLLLAIPAIMLLLGLAWYRAKYINRDKPVKEVLNYYKRNNHVGW
jgi:hypothetical protein